MLHYGRINVLEQIDVNNSNNLKQCMKCHCWCFLNKGYKYKSAVCKSCHDVLTMVFWLENIAILIIKGADYKWIIIR